MGDGDGVLMSPIRTLINSFNKSLTNEKSRFRMASYVNKPLWYEKTAFSKHNYKIKSTNSKYKNYNITHFGKDIVFCSISGYQSLRSFWWIFIISQLLESFWSWTLVFSHQRALKNPKRWTDQGYNPPKQLSIPKRNFCYIVPFEKRDPKRSDIFSI